jgi:hypothetical protein
MKVCFISHSAERGGGELSLLELIDALSQRGVECVCILPRHGPMEGLLAERNMETVVIPYKRWTHAGKPFFKRVRRVLLGHLPASFRLAAAIRRLACDVVYTNTVTVGAGALAARITGKPHIWHIREFGYEDHKLYFDLGESATRKLIGRLSAACIVNSRAVADDYRPFLGSTELDVIYNWVEVPTLGGRMPVEAPWRHGDAIRCGVLGTVAPWKGAGRRRTGDGASASNERVRRAGAGRTLGRLGIRPAYRAVCRAARLEGSGPYAWFF